MNKIEGKVLKYNGISGTIIDQNNNEYLMIKNNIKDDEVILANDIVIFIPEIFKTVEIEENVATFIEKKKI